MSQGTKKIRFTVERNSGCVVVKYGMTQWTFHNDRLLSSLITAPTYGKIDTYELTKVKEKNA